MPSSCSADTLAITASCTRTTTSTWASPPTTSIPPRCGWRCFSNRRAHRGGARRSRCRSTARAEEFRDVLKVGRTHLQDAVPITLGQEFGGYAACLVRAADDIERAAWELHELNLGATAVGTGLNAGDEYSALAIRHLARYTSLDLRPAANYFRVTQSMGDMVGYSGSLRRLGIELGKIANDLRLLSMGPRAGIAEIRLPAVQPGSSIMPGKVNPSIPEMVNQVCFQAIGCDTTVAMAAEAGQLELNVMMPVIAWNLLHASHILREAMKTLRLRTWRASLPTRIAAASCWTAALPWPRLSVRFSVREDGGDRKRSGRDRPIDSRDRARARASRSGATGRHSLAARDDSSRHRRTAGAIVMRLGERSRWR